MIKPPCLRLTIMLVALLWAPACEQTFRTGKVGNTTNAPNADGTCSAGLSVCGKDAFARCLDLQNDHEHCGACDHACLPGIACAAGTCQQVACTGPVSVSTQLVPEASSITGNDYPSSISASLADINGDGRPDLVTWRQTGKSKGSFQVALGKIGGGFQAASNYLASSDTEFIVAGDANYDGFQDLYISTLFGSPCVELWLGHADGILTPAPHTGSPDRCLGTATIADLNGDGKMDLVTYMVFTDGPTVFLADANGAFHGGTTYPARIGSTITVRDWNGDGLPDLVTMPVVLLNQGNGIFGDELNCGMYTESNKVLIADFNRDGYLDFVTSIDNKIGVLLGMGGCQFQPMTEYQLPGPIATLVQGDVNGDRIEDLVVATKDGNLFLLLGKAGGTFQIVPLSTEGVSGEIHSLLVGDITGDGKADIVVGQRPNSIVTVNSGTSTPQYVDGGPNPTRILENTCP